MTTTEDCKGCPDSLRAEGDDDRTLRLLKDHVIPALTPQKFVVTIEVHAVAPLDTVKALLDQYRTILSVPASESTQEEIESELRDLASTLENLSTLVERDISELFDTDEAFYPTIADAKMLGIEIERTCIVKDF